VLQGGVSQTNTDFKHLEPLKSRFESVLEPATINITEQHGSSHHKSNRRSSTQHQTETKKVYHFSFFIVVDLGSVDSV